MKRPSIAVGSAVLCFALLGLSAGSGSATAAPVQPAGTATAFDGMADAPTSVAALAGADVRDDYNKDGRSDMAAWYDYGDGHDAVRTFFGGSNGAFGAPGTGWQAPAGHYWVENMKRLTGDFNGDGVGDLAAFYGYEDGRVTLLTWRGRGDGTFMDALHSWTAEPGNWNFDAMTAQAGDFNGDGRDDVAVWYAYGDGSDKLFTMLANSEGGFGGHFSSFQRAPEDAWYVNRMKFATGDFNGDGRDDLAALYGYRDGRVKLMYWAGRTDGGFAEPVHGWESTGWSFRQASLHAGDFDGDGRDEVAAWYDYGDGHDAVIGFSLGTDGKFGGRREMLNLPAGSYERPQMKIVTGDYNGDGRDDLATLYGYGDGRVKTITFTAKSDGTLNSALHSWESLPGNWTFSQVHMMEGYTSPTLLPYCPAVFGHGGWPPVEDWDKDQIRAANHPTGLAQEKTWGAAGVEADLRLTKNGTKAVMWHNRTTYGLTGSSASISDLTWASGENPLDGRTIRWGPYAGETVYTFREWLDSAKQHGMAVLVEVKGETKELLLSTDASIRENAWNEVLAPIKERIASQEIMIYTSEPELAPVLRSRVSAAGLSAALTGHPTWGVDGVKWEEPPPPASANYSSWQKALDADLSRVATSWTKGLTDWMDGRCI